jgi:hypothetical protein
MRFLKTSIVLATLGAAAACGRDAKPAQQQNLAWLDSLSTAPATAATPVELGQTALAQPAAPTVAAPAVEKAAPAKTTTTHHSTTHHRAARHHSYSSSRGTYASTGSYGTYQSHTYTVKHTRRDAAIGAGAGAVLGAVAGGGHHRVRGAIVGGVLGGVAGAVIGNNVDKHRVNY